MSVLFGNVRVCIYLSISYQLKTADILANEINKMTNKQLKMIQQGAELVKIKILM